MSALCRDYRATEPPVLVAWPTNSVTLEDKFHTAVLSSKLQKIKDIANRGVNVDCFNEDGQTALFCAAFKGLAEVVNLLISLGAKPNARCQPEGYTAVHGACYSGSTTILKSLIQAGGDLRICDSRRRTPIGWSLLQPDSSKIHAVRGVIESARLCTTETSGLEMLKEMQSSLSPRTSSALGEVVRSIFRKSVVNRDVRSRAGIHINMDELSNGIHHTGFGKVYFGVGERCASVIGVPYISEVSDLEEERDDEIPSWICGKFTSFNPKVWTSRKTQVSTRQLYNKSGPHCVPDILINELEVRGKLHHPALLMMLGVCQTDHCEAISLVYERISIGSLYSTLHVDRKQLSSKFATDVIIQMCDALEYVHSMKMVHCGLSSHAIMLVANGVAKLSCFEYCLPENIHSEAAMAARHPILTSDAHLSVLRHWMAPEVLLRQQYSVRGDVYSLCCIMWELCWLDLPWSTFTLQNLRQLFSSSPNETLPLSKKKIPHLWYHLLSLGLTARKDHRDLDIAEIKDMMLLSRKPQAIQGSKGTIFGSLRRSVVSSSGVPKPPEPESEPEDGLDVVDVADFCAPNGQMYRSTSITSLPERTSSRHPQPKKTRAICAEGKYSASGDYFKIRENVDKDKIDSEEEGQGLDTKGDPELIDKPVEMKSGGFKREDVQQQQPQGILKKFGVTSKSKISIGVQSSPPQPAVAKCIDMDLNLERQSHPDKETQTEVQELDEEFRAEKMVDKNVGTGTTVVKPKRIGAIMSLGLGWAKTFSNSSDRKCKSGQTEAVSLHLSQKPPAGVSTPSPVHSPASASTPLWHSFESSRKEPLDITFDPEIQAARKDVKKKLNNIFKDRSYPVSPSKPLKKASSIKPASHSIEGVSSTASANTNEFLNYLESLGSHTSTGGGSLVDKGGVPAIKPAGHAVALERSNGKVMVQKVKNYRTKLKQPLLGSLYAMYSAGIESSEDNFNDEDANSRSHLDLPSATREESSVQTGFVFDTVDKFNAFSKGAMRRCLSYSRMPRELRRAVFQPQRYFSQPLEFQRHRVPWDRNSKDGGFSSAGDDGVEPRKETTKRGSSYMDGTANPFRQDSHSVAVQCNLSTSRSSGRDSPSTCNSSKHDDVVGDAMKVISLRKLQSTASDRDGTESTSVTVRNEGTKSGDKQPSVHAYASESSNSSSDMDVLPGRRVVTDDDGTGKTDTLYVECVEDSNGEQIDISGYNSTGDVMDEDPRYTTAIGSPPPPPVKPPSESGDQSVEFIPDSNDLPPEDLAPSSNESGSTRSTSSVTPSRVVLLEVAGSGAGSAEEVQGAFSPEPNSINVEISEPPNMELDEGNYGVNILSSQLDHGPLPFDDMIYSNNFNP